MFKILQIRLKKVGSKIRVWLLRVAGANVGHNVLIFSNAKVYNAANLRIGDNVFLNDNFWCNAKGGVIIERDVIMGPSVIIHSANHNYNDPDVPIRLQGHSDKPVHIKENVWVGAGVTILPGINICSRTILAAGAVVSSNIEISGIYGGVPAKIIKKI